MSKGEHFSHRYSLLIINSGIQQLELHTHLDSQLSVGLLQLSLSGVHLHTEHCKGVELVLWYLSQGQRSLQFLASVAYSNICGRMISLNDTYKSSACDLLIGNSRPDSSIMIVHKSNMSSSHGTELRNLQLSLQVAKSSLSGTRWSSAPHRRGARYMTLGIPEGTLVFLEGRMRCAFQTSLISFKSSCKEKGRGGGCHISGTKYGNTLLWFYFDTTAQRQNDSD